MTSDPWAPEPDPQYVDPAWLDGLHKITSVEPATPPREQLKTSDMRAEINARIAVSSQNDPPLCPQLVQKTLLELAKEADAEVPTWSASAFARWLLEQLHLRAVDGVPYDEPREPDWSLDPDPKQYRRGEPQ